MLNSELLSRMVYVQSFGHMVKKKRRGLDSVTGDQVSSMGVEGEEGHSEDVYRRVWTSSDQGSTCRD